MAEPLDIFLVCVPGLEPVLAEEARALGFDLARPVPGGVEIVGGWPDIWRANLWLRGATRVLVRLGSFPAAHLGQLEKNARAFPWTHHLNAREPVRLDVVCRRSRISRADAASQKLERALRQAAIPVTKQAKVTLKLRINDDICEISVDTSGEPLHKRGHKAAVGKAPLRETMAALFLRQAGYVPGEPLVDPMCGSGTFLIEAAEIAAGLAPGRDRAFAFEHLKSFHPAQRPKANAGDPVPSTIYGFDRDDGAIRSAAQNAARAWVSCTFTRQPVSDLAPPTTQPGLVICNPPYGARIGQQKALFALYGTLGDRLRAGFGGWRVAIVTSDEKLARATKQPFLPKGPPVAHGGLKVWLFRTGTR